MLKKTICDRKKLSGEMIGNEKGAREREGEEESDGEKGKVANYSLLRRLATFDQSAARLKRERENETEKDYSVRI